VAILVIVATVVVLNSGFETTDNAYVNRSKAPVSASIAGRVVAVYVHENQFVRAGQPLFRLDAKPLQADVDQSAAKLAQAELQVHALKAAYAERLATLQAARETLAYTEREAVRQGELVKAGVSSEQQHAQAAHAAGQARQQVAGAQQQVALALADLGGAPERPVERHPTVLAARAELEHVQLTASYGVVTAPVDGVVTRVDQLQPGSYVEAAQTVFWLLSGQPWVDANFKEDQLGRMRIGQHVSIKIDAYPGHKLDGHVASFSPGTGSAFSALPAQNASGNWVKVTQRLPVRIDFDHAPPATAASAGLSAQVKVDLKSPSESGRPG
jgi:membrane fusion protein (multidrug efflux system)